MLLFSRMKFYSPPGVYKDNFESPSTWLIWIFLNLLKIAIDEIDWLA